ncbi:MAG: YkvA family protein [Cyclobacteriaceae bacterium]
MNKSSRIWNEAKKTVSENDRVKKLVTRAVSKLKGIAANSGQFRSLSEKIPILIRMAKAHISGSYSAFSGKTMLMIVFALSYFVIPTDAIPDFIPALGFTDDISILYFVWRHINEDVTSFLQWEQTG